MKQQHLRSFIAVVEEGGFRTAAKRVGISQPSLSQHIGHLEDHMGLELFHRTPEGVEPTRAGELLFERAKVIVGLIDETRDLILEDQGGAHQSVGISAIPTLAPFVLPAALDALSDRYQHMTVRIEERTTDDLYNAVVTGQTDLGIVATTPSSCAESVALEHLADEPLVLAMASGSEWAARPHLCAEDLQQAGVIILGELHCLGEQVSEFCATQGVERVIQIESGQIATIIELVRRDVGISLLPGSTLAGYNTEGLTIRSIKDGAPSRPIYMVRNRLRPQSEVAQHLASCITGLFAQTTLAPQPQ